MHLNWNDEYNKKIDFTCHWFASSLLLIQYQKLSFCLGLFSGCSRLSVMVTSYLIPVTRDCHFIWQKGLCSCDYVKGLEKRLPWNLWSGPGVIPGVLVTGRQEEFKSEQTVEADLWSEAGRGREPEAPLKPPEGTLPSRHLDFKLLTLTTVRQPFVTAAIGNDCEEHWLNITIHSLNSKRQLSSIWSSKRLQCFWYWFGSTLC